MSARARASAVEPGADAGPVAVGVRDHPERRRLGVAHERAAGVEHGLEAALALVVRHPDVEVPALLVVLLGRGETSPSSPGPWNHSPGTWPLGSTGSPFSPRRRAGGVEGAEPLGGGGVEAGLELGESRGVGPGAQVGGEAADLPREVEVAAGDRRRRRGSPGSRSPRDRSARCRGGGWPPPRPRRCGPRGRARSRSRRSGTGRGSRSGGGASRRARVPRGPRRRSASASGRQPCLRPCHVWQGGAMGREQGIRAGVVHAATTVPRLFVRGPRGRTSARPARCRCCASPRPRSRTSTARGRGVPGRTNALRHFIWQAMLTARFDRSVAVSIARAQERGTPSARDSRVDDHNNAVGQDYGEEHPTLATGSISRGRRPARRGRAGQVGVRRADLGQAHAVRPTRSCSPSGQTARTTPAAASALRHPGHGGSVM